MGKGFVFILGFIVLCDILKLGWRCLMSSSIFYGLVIILFFFMMS